MRFVNNWGYNLFRYFVWILMFFPPKSRFGIRGLPGSIALLPPFLKGGRGDYSMYSEDSDILQQEKNH